MNPLPLSLRDLVHSLEFLFETEDSINKHGLLQKINPILRIASVFLLIISSLFISTPLPLLLLCVIPITLALLSKVPMKAYLLRSTVFIPIFAGIISIPIIFLTSGQPLFSWNIGPWTLIGTHEGLLRFSIFTLRVWFSVASLMLLIMTMGINEILSTFSTLRVPPIFVQMVAMTYRYIVLSILDIQKMLFAREARTFIRRNRLNINDLKNFGSILGLLFIRTYARSEHVYLAMKARGFDVYHVTPVERKKVVALDVAFIIVLCIVIFFLVSGVFI